MVLDSASGYIYQSSSSRRFKRNIQPYEVDLAKLQSLRPVRFRWNEKSATPDVEDFGLIAEEVREVLPELVHMNAGGEPESVDYAKLSVILLKAVQELNRELEELRQRIR